MRGPFALEREMGCTREDLLRWLPDATGHAPARVEGDTVVLSVGGGEVRIATHVRPQRRIGLAVSDPTGIIATPLPTLTVTGREDALTLPVGSAVRKGDLSPRSWLQQVSAARDARIRFAMRLSVDAIRDCLDGAVPAIIATCISMSGGPGRKSG